MKFEFELFPQRIYRYNMDDMDVPVDPRPSKLWPQKGKKRCAIAARVKNPRLQLLPAATQLVLPFFPLLSLLLSN